MAARTIVDNYPLNSRQKLKGTERCQGMRELAARAIIADSFFLPKSVKDNEEVQKLRWDRGMNKRGDLLAEAVERKVAFYWSPSSVVRPFRTEDRRWVISRDGGAEAERNERRTEKERCREKECLDVAAIRISFLQLDFFFSLTKALALVLLVMIKSFPSLSLLKIFTKTVKS